MSDPRFSNFNKKDGFFNKSKASAVNLKKYDLPPDKKIYFGIYHKYIPFGSSCLNFGGFDIEIDDDTTYKTIKDKCKEQIQDAMEDNGTFGRWLSGFSNFIEEKKLDVNKIETFKALYDLIKSDPGGYQKEKILSKKEPVAQIKNLYNSLIKFKANPDNFKISSVSINNSKSEFKTPTKLNIKLNDNDKIKEKLKINEETESVYLIINN